MTFDEAVARFPIASINQRPPHVIYTPWHLLEHLRLAQWDILEFIQNPHHVSPEWPDGYWPARDEETDEEGWKQTINQFQADLAALADIVADPGTDLYADLPHAPGYNILREILVVADHNAYHIGEFAILRQVMGTWA
jgi:hypothetical protein